MRALTKKFKSLHVEESKAACTCMYDELKLYMRSLELVVRFGIKDSFCLDKVPDFYKRLYNLFKTMEQIIQAEKNKQTI